MYSRAWVITDFNNKIDAVHIKWQQCKFMKREIYESWWHLHQNWRYTFKLISQHKGAPGRSFSLPFSCDIYDFSVLFKKRAKGARSNELRVGPTDQPTLCYYRINGIVALDGTCANLQRTFRLNARPFFSLLPHQIAYSWCSFVHWVNSRCKKGSTIRSTSSLKGGRQNFVNTPANLKICWVA